MLDYLFGGRGSVKGLGIQGGRGGCVGESGRAQPWARRPAWALSVRPGHVGSMAASSADDHLTVGGDADVVVSADPEHAAGPSLYVPARWLLDGGTQSMPLSAAIKQRLS